LFGFALLLLLCCSRRSRLLDGARREAREKEENELCRGAVDGDEQRMSSKASAPLCRSLARSLSLSFARSLSLSLSLSLSRARARTLLRGARHEALESDVRHFAVNNERRTHLKTATVESRTGDVIFQILRELSAKFCGELALFFRRQTESAGWRRRTITSPKFNTFRLLQRAPTPASRKETSPLVYVCCATGEETSFEAESQAR
jgi:hypothetical protein